MRGSQVYRRGPLVERGPQRDLKVTQSNFAPSWVPTFQNNAFQPDAFQMGEGTFIDPTHAPGLMTSRVMRVATIVERG